MKIMIVDDEPNNIHEIQDMIFRTGKIVDVQCFTNPIAALDKAKEEKFDLTLLDIQMPSMNGLDLAEELSRINPAMDIVFITAFNHYATEAFEVNAVDYLLKPLRYERFEKIFNKVTVKSIPTPAVHESLEIYVLGEFRCSCKDPIKWNRPKTYELFAFLLMNKEKKIHKDTLAEVLWPELDSKRGLANLQVTMCRLRKDLCAFFRDEIEITYTQPFYVMKIREVWMDGDTFITLAESKDTGDLEKAFKLYDGELFAHESWCWATGLRMFYQKVYETLSLKLGELYVAQRDYQKVIKLIEAYLPKGLPNEGISLIYLDAVAQQGDKRRNQDAIMLIEKWYAEMLDMSVPKEIIKGYN